MIATVLNYTLANVHDAFAKATLPAVAPGLPAMLSPVMLFNP
jgi:hypothetical protein